MPTPRSLAWFAPLGLVVACSRTESTAGDAAAPSVAVAAVDAGAPAQPKDAGHRGAGALPAKERAKALKDLNEGRRLSRAKDWTAAMKAFESVLAVAPDDVHALSELGWAAFQANELTRAESANRRALASAKTPSVRAPILYNIGRVAEARGNRDAAAKAYAESLALRDNAEVKKRLGALDAGAPSSEGTPRLCSQSFADTAAACACFLAHKDEMIMSLGDPSALVCKTAASSLLLGTPSLGVLEWGTDEGGEMISFLTVREGGKIRTVAELGRAYEPGAFGVHNSANVVGGTKQTVNGHDVFVVRSEQHDNDYNLGGLELCTREEKLDTVCAVGEAPGSTRCVAIPVETESGCGPGVEPDEIDMDEGTKKELAEIRKNAKTTRVKTAWTIANDGTVTVTLREGARESVSEHLFVPRRLW